MTDTGWDFVLRDQQELVNAQTLGEAFARIIRNRWPRDTAKQAARRFNLEPSTAANAVRGQASERTVAKAIQTEGWALGSALIEAMTCQTYEQHLEEQANAARAALAEIETRRVATAELVRRARARGPDAATGYLG